VQADPPVGLRAKPLVKGAKPKALLKLKAV